MDCNNVSLGQSVSFWKKELVSAPRTVEFPVDRPRSTPVRSNEIQSFPFPAELFQRIEALARREMVDSFDVMVAAFSILLSRYSRQDDIVFGTAKGVSALRGNGELFEGVLVLHCDLTKELNFRELLHRIESAMQRSEAQAVPFSALVESLALNNQSGRNPIFQVLFAEQEVGSEQGNGVHQSPLWPSGTELLDLAIMVCKWGHATSLTVRYDSKLFEPGSIERLAANFLVLLDSASTSPDTSVSVLPMLTEAERQQLVVKWNDTAVNYPRNIPLHKFIEKQVERSPEAIAVVCGSKHITYRQLNNRANQLANRLQKLGAGPDVLVAICAERSLEMVIALLGTLKAGGAYVPFDPDYPRQRLLTMLQDCRSPVVLTQSHLLERLPDSDARIICLDRDWPDDEGTSNLSVEVTGKNLAYCIYTSGSTGQPKGVLNIHEAIVNRLLWVQDKYPLRTGDRYLQKTPYSFDVSVQEFFWPLMTGATLVMARPGGHKDPAYLVNLIQEQQITALHFVPSMLAVFLEAEGLERCPSVRQVFTSGEALSFELQSRFFERFHVKLNNLYGPTEAAVDVTYWDCGTETGKSIVPIGRPVANTQIYILDRHLQPVPIGVAGELHIGGVQLARGYLNRPELTAEKFIRDPFSGDPGARIYKTGDLARFLPDGEIEYLGRIDHQIKLRGFRIELGEIEAVLTECTGVCQAAVIVREDVPGNQTLVAYLAPASGQEISLESVRAHLTEKLPEFMVPPCFVILKELPVTTSGKVDRRALPKPERDASREIISARNELESALLPLFRKILGTPSVGVTDDFFELGGHSLNAALLLSEIRKITGRTIPLSVMLRASSVESLARTIAGDEEVVADSVATQVQKGENSRQPLFAVVVPGVEALGYAALARHLGRQQPLYKLQGKSPIPAGRPYTREEIRKLAEEYIAAMRSVQPRGPYHIIGMCDDVQVCEEMVLQLERGGEQVGLFANLDTWALQNTMVPWKWRIYYYTTRLLDLMKLRPSQSFRALTKLLQRKIEGGRQLESGSQNVWPTVYWPGPEFQPPVFQTSVLLFKRPRQPFYYINDPALGWGQRSRGGVDIQEIELDHTNLLREPHIKTIGKILAGRLQNYEVTDLDHQRDQGNGARPRA